MALSTVTKTEKESSTLLSVCGMDKMSDIIWGDLFSFLLCVDFFGVVGDAISAAVSISSDKSSTWLSDSSGASSGAALAVRVMWILRAAPCRSAAELLNSGYTPVKIKRIRNVCQITVYRKYWHLIMTLRGYDKLLLHSNISFNLIFTFCLIFTNPGNWEQFRSESKLLSCTNLMRPKFI